MTGLYRCSRCGNEKLINQQEYFPACTNCNIPGMKWLHYDPEEAVARNYYRVYAGNRQEDSKQLTLCCLQEKRNLADNVGGIRSEV